MVRASGHVNTQGYFTLLLGKRLLAQLSKDQVLHQALNTQGICPKVAQKCREHLCLDMPLSLCTLTLCSATRQTTPPGTCKHFSQMTLSSSSLFYDMPLHCVHACCVLCSWE
eukprot:1160929-Pelagomonas_calceolata.AAC.4